MQVRKQQLELGMEQQTGFKSGKEYIKAVYCHPACLTCMQSTSWETLGWMKHKLESRLMGEISIITLMAESEEELKSLLMKVKEESGKSGLKLNMQKTKIMASGPITSWQIDGETMERVTDFIFLGSNITTDIDCSLEIKNKQTKKMLVPWKKSYSKPRQVIKKQRHYFANKGPYRQSYGFSSSHAWMWDLDHKEGWDWGTDLLNCSVGEDSWESLELQGDQASQS